MQTLLPGEVEDLTDSLPLLVDPDQHVEGESTSHRDLFDVVDLDISPGQYCHQPGGDTRTVRTVDRYQDRGPLVSHLATKGKRCPEFVWNWAADNRYHQRFHTRPEAIPSPRTLSAYPATSSPATMTSISTSTWMPSPSPGRSTSI